MKTTETEFSLLFSHFRMYAKPVSTTDWDFYQKQE